MTRDNFWDVTHSQAEYRDHAKGSDDGSSGRPIPADASETYRKSYANTVKSNRRTSLIVHIIQSTAITFVIPILYSTLIIGPTVRAAQAREQRIISYYQNHGPCPHDLDAKGVDARTISWNNEVEHPRR